MIDALKKILPDHTAERRCNTLAVRVGADSLSAAFRSLAATLPFTAMFASDESGAFRIHYVFGLPHSGANSDAFVVLVLHLEKESFPSLAHEFPACALYERLIKSMFGLTPEGHPDPRSLTLHEENWPLEKHPMQKDFLWNTRVPEQTYANYPYAGVGGEGMYEIPVGPVHAGIIEPGHFRFSVAGEEIIALEARLGWVHKGVEKLFEHLPPEKHVPLSERISGDSSFSHSLAYCQALESLTGTTVTDRARYIRLICAELERLTMHIFDIGNIGGNGTGLTFMAAQGFRMVENLRRISETLTGSRFLRGVNSAGGVSTDISTESASMLTNFLAELETDFTEIMRVVDGSASFANRVKDTGTLPRDIALENHVVGIAARSCNIPRDTRLEHPYAAYTELVPKIALETSCDVEARFRVRVKEVYTSLQLIRQALTALPSGPTLTPLKPIPDNGFAIGAVEGWRGEIIYAMLSRGGKIARVAVRDPSFIHWQLFPLMVTKDMVPDFPLINKSLNLSYTGNDL